MKRNGSYLFLYLNTGGGHLAPARSLQEALRAESPDTIETVLHDGFTGAPRFLHFMVEDSYRWMQSSAPWVYAIVYAIHKIALLRWLSAAVVSHYISKRLESYILRERPAKIAIFHFLLIKPVADILERHALTIPTVVVVTDPYTAHPMWFARKHLYYILFSTQLKKHCLHLGIPDEQLRVFPYVLHPKYSEMRTDEELSHLKHRLLLDPTKKIILLLGGADGMPNGFRIVKRLLQLSHKAEILCICGRNEKFYKRVIQLQQFTGHSSLKVFGYVDNVHEFIAISDVVVTKCGASTFMEILHCGKIPVVNRYLWEQERGNVDFLREHAIGIYERRVHQLPQIIDRLISDTSVLQSIRQNIKRTRVENGTPLVCKFLLQFQG
ncbi:MAG: glycosyltransferase [Bacteroidota bacterium]